MALLDRGFSLRTPAALIAIIIFRPQSLPSQLTDVARNTSDVPSNEKMGLSYERWSVVGCPLLDLQASPSQADVVVADRASAPAQATGYKIDRVTKC